MMISARCYCCGVIACTPYAEENGYRLVKCGACGLLYVANPPDPAEISRAQMHGKHRGTYEFDSTFRFEPGKLKHYNRVLCDLFGDVRPSGEWLDVGCGYGEFMLAVMRRGNESLQIRGLEPSIAKRKSAQSRGLRVDYTDLASMEERFDTIALLNVYSHLPDPLGFLEKLKMLLRPGGELIIETGNTADMPPSLHHRPLYLPDHLSFASEEIIRHMVSRVGFEVTRVCKYPLIRPTVSWLLKQVVKSCLPGKQSEWRLAGREYRAVDMFMRARLIK